MGEEYVFHLCHILASLLCIQEVRHHHCLALGSSWADNSEGFWLWDPPILPDMNTSSVTYTPPRALHNNLISSLHNVFGSLNTLIMYVGVACAMALMRISLPALDRSLPFHPVIFLPTWFLMRLNAFLLPLPTIGGSPRYFSWCWMISTPNFCLTWNWTSLFVFLLKNREVFSLLSFCPESLHSPLKPLSPCHIPQLKPYRIWCCCSQITGGKFSVPLTHRNPFYVTIAFLLLQHCRQTLYT